MATDSPVGSGYARTRDIVVVALLLVLLTSALVVLLVQMWPPAPRIAPDGRPTATPDTVPVHLFGWTPKVSRESSMFVIVLAAGAIGATVHAMRSLFWYVGNRSLRRSWLMMYLFLPLTGALLALVVYLVLRGGLTSPAGGATDVNPYGMAAIAALVGLFSRETSEKLRAVFSTLLAPAQSGRDQALPPQLHRLEPATGAVGSVVTLRGSGLGSVSVVRFGPVETPAVDVTDTSVRAMVPAGAGTGPLVVVSPGGSATSSEPFTVE